MSKKKTKTRKKSKAKVKEEEFVDLDEVSDPKTVAEELSIPKQKDELKVKKQELIQKLKEDKKGIEKELGELQLKENEKLLEDKGVCKKCGTSLELDPNDFLDEGIGRRRVTCPNCHMINEVSIRLAGPPTEEKAKIELRKVEYAWNVKATQNLTNEQLVAKLVDEARRIDEGRNKQPPVVKTLIKVAILQQEEIEGLKNKLKGGQ